MKGRLWVALTFLGLAMACSNGQPNPSDPKIRQEIVVAMEHYTALIRAVASDSIAAMYTEDGELLEAGLAPLRGPKEIREFLAQFDGKVLVDSASTVVTRSRSSGARPISGDPSPRLRGCGISHRRSLAAGT